MKCDIVIREKGLGGEIIKMVCLLSYRITHKKHPHALESNLWEGVMLVA
jgi:hypothetical protein